MPEFFTFFLPRQIIREYLPWWQTFPIFIKLSLDYLGYPILDIFSRIKSSGSRGLIGPKHLAFIKFIAGFLRFFGPILEILGRFCVFFADFVDFWSIFDRFWGGDFFHRTDFFLAPEQIDHGRFGFGT